ncbi:hypothetical protein RR46_13644 [Papilio xuthus]|uniref:Uncharacterized protein n=1 Tax=Papilio xuthus TaxID=66420 RepID=A0A194PH97_PAPXU|nr:hypothetical protein RR46_13644 [Papilio xuthus]
MAGIPQRCDCRVFCFLALPQNRPRVLQEASIPSKLITRISMGVIDHLGIPAASCARRERGAQGGRAEGAGAAARVAGGGAGVVTQCDVSEPSARYAQAPSSVAARSRPQNVAP